MKEQPIPFYPTVLKLQQLSRQIGRITFGFDDELEQDVVYLNELRFEV